MNSVPAEIDWDSWSPEAQQALLPNIARQQPAPPPTNISRITLDVTDDDIVVSHDNRFLHDNVD